MEIENIEARLENICADGLRRIFPKGIPNAVEGRFNNEICDIRKQGYAASYIAAMELVEKSETAGYQVSTRGETAGSLIAYLSGITDINPMEAHYYCLMCGKYEPAENCYSVADDMRDKICHKCRCKMTKQGYSLPAEPFTGINGEKRPYFDFNLPHGYDEVIKNHLNDNPVDEYTVRFQVDYGMTLLYLLKKCTGAELKYSQEYRDEIIQIFRDTYEHRDVFFGGTVGLPEFGSDRMISLIKVIKPGSIEDIIRLDSLSHGTDAWEGNAESLIRNNTADFSEVITSRDDVYLYLVSKGITHEAAYEIMEIVGKGKACDGKNEKWNASKLLMKEHDIPDWYVDSCEKIRYLFPKAHCAVRTMVNFSIALYKIYYPKEFYTASTIICR